MTKDGKWPYELRDRESISVERFSISTQSMVHYSLAVASGKLPFHEFTTTSSHGTKAPKAPKLDGTLQLKIEKSLQQSISLFEGRDDLSADIAAGTFGKNNAFTLSWLLPISSGCSEELRKRVRAIAETSLKETKRNADGSIVAISPSKEFELTTHAFPALKALQLKRLLYPTRADEPCSVNECFSPQSLGEWIYSRMLDHIAFAKIKDGPFDAAELAFSLEGYLLCRPRLDDGCNHDRDAIDCAFATLESRQALCANMSETTLKFFKVEGTESFHDRERRQKS